MKNIIFIISLILTTFAYSQITYTEYIDSYELEEVREIKIYLPPSYQQDSTRIYPVAFVLDADYLFGLYVGNSVLFSQKEKAPEQIVIGISQGGDRRYQDCTYDPKTSYPTGKSDAFYRFIRGELSKYVSDRFRTAPFRTIVGNTITANFINYFFIEDSPGFDAFININPYFAPNMAQILSNNVDKVKNNSYYYYVSSGNHNSEKRHTAISTVDQSLASKTNEKFNYKYDEFNETTLTASIGQSVSNAMAFIFEIYSSISKEEFETKIKDLSPPDAIAYLENKYVEIEYLFGTNLKIRERDIYAIEPIIIDKENGEFLRDFGEMIYDLYPESHLGDYYIGLDFEFRGKYKQALEAYKEGYMKIEGNPENAESFYTNVERVLKKMN